MEEISTPTTSRIPTKKIWGAIKTLKKSVRQEIAEAVIMYCSGEGYDPETAKHDTTKALFTLIKYDLDNIAAYDSEKINRDEKRSEINRQNRINKTKTHTTTIKENNNEKKENIIETTTTTKENNNEKPIYKNINIKNRNLFLNAGISEQTQNEILNFFNEKGTSLEVAEKFMSYNLANHKKFPLVWQDYAMDFIRNEKAKENDSSGGGEKLLTYQEVSQLEVAGKKHFADFDKIPQPNGKFLYKLKTL
ncbi:MAG: hypothetical protein II956_08305 [Bacteroidales bacterium]|nr:hypothetical protein [Bacteroidales bacterium]